MSETLGRALDYPDQGEAVSQNQVLPAWRIWLIWALGATFYFYEFFLQVSPSVMVPELMQAFSVTAESLGLLVGIYFYAYAPMQIPVGLLVDTYGPRRLLTFATALCAVSSLAFGSADSLMVAQMARLSMGFGSAFAVIGTFKLAATWFPVERFAFLTGLTLTLGMTGAMGGGVIMAYLVAQLHWRGSMILMGSIGLILAALIWLVVRDKTGDVEDDAVPISLYAGFFRKLKQVIKSRQTWMASVWGGLLFASTPAFGGLWGVPFIKELYDLERPAAAKMVSLLFIGWAVGAPIFGWFSGRIRKRKPPLFISATGALVLMSTILYVSDIPITMMCVLLFGFGFFTSAFLPVFSIVREINPQYTSATALGFANTLNSAGAAALQPLIGLMLDANWSGGLVDGIRYYSVHDFRVALSILPVLLTISLLLLPFVRETNCEAKF